GPEIGQGLGRPRTGQNAAEIEDANAGERAGRRGDWRVASDWHVGFRFGDMDGASSTADLPHSPPATRRWRPTTSYSPGSHTPALRMRHSRASSARRPIVRAVALISSETVVRNTPGTTAWQKAQAARRSSLKPNRPEAAMCSR